MVYVGHCTTRRYAMWAFTQGVAKVSISFSFITFMRWLIVGVPKITGTRTTKFNKSQITRAILSSSQPWTPSTWTCMMTQPKGQVSTLPKPTQVTHLLTRSVIYIYLHTIVEKGYTALSIDPYCSYIFDLIPPEKGLGFKKGDCLCCPMLWVSPPWVPSVWSSWLEGPGLPSLVPSPPFTLNGQLIWMPSPVDTRR